MVSRTLIQKIPSNQCIGDSLRTINTNFSALEVGIRSIPAVIEGEGFDLEFKITPSTQQTYLELSPTRFPTFYREFDYISSTVEDQATLALSDSTTIKGYKFPYTLPQETTKPFGTFIDIASQVGYPKLTLFWTASSTDNLATVFPLNSAASTEPDNEVLCFYKEEDILYVGGSFTKIGEQTASKFATIDLSSPAGTFVSLSAYAFLPNFSTGSIKAITKATATINSTTQKLLILGGDFVSDIAGRGLLIYNETLKKVSQPFYFNGTVNDLLVDSTNGVLYVVGQFDWVNIGSTAAPETSNERLYCNNFAKIILDYVETPNPFDLEFINNSSNALNSSIVLNTVAYYDQVIYVSGELEISSEAGEILHKNLLCLRRYDDETTGLPKGSLITDFKFVFDKPIYTSIVDNEQLYLGGQFTLAASHDDFYNIKLQNRQETLTYYHAACLNLSNRFSPTLNKVWKPRFNDIIYKLEVVDASFNTEIYALGVFTEVNYEPVSYLAAITKATSLLGETPKGLTRSWRAYLDRGVGYNTNALLRDASGGLYVGGNFNKINGQTRNYFGKVSNLFQDELLTIEFEVGGEVIGQGQNLSIDFNSIEKQTKAVGSTSNGVINKTTFTPFTQTFKGLRSNQLCRYYIKRSGINDVLQSDVYLLGWSLVYEKI